MENQIVNAKQKFTKIGYSLFTMMIVSTVVQIIITIFLSIFFPGIQQNPWYIGLLLGIPFYFTAFPIFLWMMKKTPNSPKGEAKKISFNQLLVVFFISMASVYIFNIVGYLVNIIISLIKGSNVINPLDVMIGMTNIIPTIVFLGILSPIVEEIIFRGVLLDKLREYGDRTAILFTAFTFGLFHGNFSQFFYAFAIGLILGYIAFKTNTIRYTIIMHIAINIIGSVVVPALALSNNNTFVMLSGIIVVLFIIIGFILFIINFKKIELDTIENNTYKTVRNKVVYGNIGMILFYILCLVSFISVIMV